MVSIQQFYNFTSANGLFRAEEYTLHTKKDKDRTRYIVGLNTKDDGKPYYFHNPNITEALIEAVEISNRLPKGRYNTWREIDKDKADHEALYFYNKYGHLGIQNYLVYILEHNLQSHYDMHYYDMEDFYPINSKKNKTAVEIDSSEEIKNKYSEFRQQINTVIHVLHNEKNLSAVQRLFLEQKLLSLREEKYKIKIYQKYNTIIPIESIGEPVYMFVDLIWYLARCMETWDRYLREKPSLYSRYFPSKNDDLIRLCSDFEFPLCWAWENKNGLYFAGDELIEQNKIIKTENERYNPVTQKKEDNLLAWPLWREVLDYYGQKIVLNVEMDFDNSEPVMKYDVESLFQLMDLALLTDVERDLSRKFRQCKNPNCSNFVYPTGNRIKLYCSSECASAHNSYKTRRRKAGLQVET